MYRWKKQARLPCFRCTCRSAYSCRLAPTSHTDLQTITEQQERAVISAVDGYFHEATFPADSFVCQLRLLSRHLHIAPRRVDGLARTMGSRASSKGLPVHVAQPLGRVRSRPFQVHSARITRLLSPASMGEVSTWPVAEIKRCFKHSRASGRHQGLARLCQCPRLHWSVQHPRFAFTQSWVEELSTPRTHRTSRAAVAAAVAEAAGAPKALASLRGG